MFQFPADKFDLHGIEPPSSSQRPPQSFIEAPLWGRHKSRQLWMESAWQRLDVGQHAHCQLPLLHGEENHLGHKCPIYGEHACARQTHLSWQQIKGCTQSLFSLLIRLLIIFCFIDDCSIKYEKLVTFPYNLTLSNQLSLIESSNPSYSKCWIKRVLNRLNN